MIEVIFKSNPDQEKYRETFTIMDFLDVEAGNRRMTRREYSDIMAELRFLVWTIPQLNGGAEAFIFDNDKLVHRLTIRRVDNRYYMLIDGQFYRSIRVSRWEL